MKANLPDKIHLVYANPGNVKMKQQQQMQRTDGQQLPVM